VTVAPPATPLRARVLWGLYALYVVAIVVSAGTGIITVLLRGGPLSPAATADTFGVTPIDPASPAPAALKRCHADLDGLYHQLRERVVTLGIAVRDLDPSMAERWQRWSATWRAELEAVAVRCALTPRPAHPALGALADAAQILGAAEERYLAALAELTRDESRSLTAAEAALRAAKDALGRTP